MKRFLSTRFGFFTLAAIVCGATWFVIDEKFGWVSIGMAALYAVLAVLFLLDDVGRSSAEPPAGAAPPSPYAPPPFIGRS